MSTLLLDPGDEHWRAKTHLTQLRGGHVYAKVATVPLHRILMGSPPGCDIDHINGNTLDNRRSNLRIVSRSVNNVNSSKVWAKSGYKGVGFHPFSGLWYARMKKDGKVHSFGYHKTPERAHVARLHGEKALFGIQPQRRKVFLDAGIISE